MDDTTLVLVQATLTAAAPILGSLAIWYRMKAERDKELANAKASEASAVSQLTGSALEIVKALEHRLDESEAELKALRREVRSWKRGCSLLIKQLVDAGIVPVWDPNGYTTDSSPP